MCIRDRSKKSAVSSSSLHNGASNPRTSSHGRSGEEPIKPKRAAPISKGECNCNARRGRHLTTFQTTDLRIVAQCERDMRARRQTTVVIPMGRGNFTLTGVIESVVKSKHGSRYLSKISIQTQSHLYDVPASNLNFSPDPRLLP